MRTPFDLTPKELIEGAKQGCLLMRWIMGQREFRLGSGFSTMFQAPFRSTKYVFQMRTYGMDQDIMGVICFQFEYESNEGPMKLAQTTEKSLTISTNPGKSF